MQFPRNSYALFQLPSTVATGNSDASTVCARKLRAPMPLHMNGNHGKYLAQAQQNRNTHKARYLAIPNASYSTLLAPIWAHIE